MYFSELKLFVVCEFDKDINKLTLFKSFYYFCYLFRRLLLFLVFTVKLYVTGKIV